MRTSPAVSLALLALLVGGSLAGCSMQVTDPAAGSPGPDTAVATGEAADPASAPAEEEKPEAEEPAEQEPADTGASEERQLAIDAVTATVACDGGERTLDQSGAVVRVEGPCDVLIVSMDAGVVVADDVTRLRITGTGNVVYALEVGSIEVSGDINGVLWNGATPAVTDTGVSNTLLSE